MPVMDDAAHPGRDATGPDGPRSTARRARPIVAHPGGLLIPSVGDGDPGWPQVQAALRSMRAFRLYRGVYVLSDAWEGSSPDERRRLCCVGAALTHPGRHLTGRAAAVMLGYPLPGPLDAIDLAHGGRHNAGLVVAGHSGAPPIRFRHVRSAERGVVSGVPCATAGEVVVQLARCGDFAGAVAAADGHLRAGGCAVDLLRVAAAGTRRVRSLTAVKAISVASALSESPLESSAKAALVTAGIGGWAQQVTLVRAVDRTPLARVDFWFPAEGVVLELDGAVKYEEAFGGADVVVKRERRREKLLVNEGAQVIRGGFAELDDGSLLRSLDRVLGDAPVGGYAGGRLLAFGRHESLPADVRRNWGRA